MRKSGYTIDMEPNNITKSEVARKVELLAPAGDWDCLQAAVKNGADAVYLGVKEFNARANARNFSLEELKKAVEYCHTQGVSVYLTLNILVKNTEYNRYFDVLSRAYVSGIDGVIIQHISFVELIKKSYPGLQVFVSTQGAIGNTAAARLVEQADRIIAPREMPLEEVRKMVSAGHQVEVFVHGALCFSYSGLCLFSSFVANRSGNRGNCAQLCRQKFNAEYPLSTRELCTVRRIPEFIEAGISAFKIEGRMRSALYVAVATRLYRKAVDAYLAGQFKVPEKELSEIEVVFNREFTEGLIGGDSSLISSEKPMNRGACLGVMEEGLITLQRSVSRGDGLGIWNKENVTGATVQNILKDGQPVKTAQKGERVDLGIGARDGSRIYLTSSAEIKIEPDFQLHRTPLKRPSRQRPSVALPRLSKQPAPVLQRFLARAYSVAEAHEIARSGADIVFYDIFASDYPDPGQWQERTELGAYLPRIMSDSALNKAVSLLGRKKPAAVLTGNPGFLSCRNHFSRPVYLDYSINVFNDLDVNFFRQQRAIPMLSPELSLLELSAFKDREVLIYCHGDIILVNSCIPLECDSLKDDKGYSFTVRRENGYWQVLNSRPFGMFNDLRKLKTAGFNQFYIDEQGHSAHYILFYRSLLKQPVEDRRERKGFTAGHLYKGVD